MASQCPVEHAWSPYTDNGGTSLAVAGKDYAVLVADTRLSKGYSILTRDCTKCTQLTKNCVISSCGMKSDAITLHKMLKIRIVTYVHNHRREPSVTAIAQMLSTMLYHKRFFPYYTFNIIAGVDDKGVGAVYHYDAIGSFERCPYTTSGSGSSLVMSTLDSQISKENKTVAPAPLDKTETVALCKDALSSVGERDIFTGDFGEIFLIDAQGVTVEKFELRLD